MDRNPSPSKGPRIYNESEPADEQKCSNLQTRLCNELVYEVCKEIPLIGTADDILLTALNIRTYLAKRFRKKLIFCEAVAFIKAWLNKERKGVVIQIDRVAQSNESEHVLRQQQQLDNVFELRTDYFRIRIETNKSLDENDVRFVDEDQFGNAHVQYFLRLIVPLLQPIELRLTGLTVIQSKLSGHLVHLRAKYFLSPNISAALADYNHLAIYQSSLGSDKFPQFIRTFIRWLNVNGKSKRFFSRNHRQDFYCAHACPPPNRCRRTAIHYEQWCRGAAQISAQNQQLFGWLFPLHFETETHRTLHSNRGTSPNNSIDTDASHGSVEVELMTK